MKKSSSYSDNPVIIAFRNSQKILVDESNENMSQIEMYAVNKLKLFKKFQSQSFDMIHFRQISTQNKYSLTYTQYIFDCIKRTLEGFYIMKTLSQLKNITVPLMNREAKIIDNKLRNTNFTGNQTENSFEISFAQLKSMDRNTKNFVAKAVPSVQNYFKSKLVNFNVKDENLPQTILIGIVNHSVLSNSSNTNVQNMEISSKQFLTNLKRIQEEPAAKAE